MNELLIPAPLVDLVKKLMDTKNPYEKEVYINRLNDIRSYIDSALKSNKQFSFIRSK